LVKLPAAHAKNAYIKHYVDVDIGTMLPGSDLELGTFSSAGSTSQR